MGYRTQNRMLLIASYIFYGWWDIRFLFLIVISTVVDFCAGLLIGNGEINLRERRFASFYAIASAFLFVTIQWDAVTLFNAPFQVQWSNLLASGLGWAVLGSTVILVLIANLSYPFLINITPQRRRNIAIIASVVSNLVILGFFKYFNFFISSAETALSWTGWNLPMLRLNIILPVGISFYTFQTMSYTIDIYREKMKPTDRFLDFALFVAYFPQLVAGPIERASHLLPCLLKPRKLNFPQTAHGLHLILLGLFKKVAIADGVARTVNQVYGSTGTITGIDVLVATSAFALQIYGDFSGYTDIARGVSKLLGIDLINNFKTPYFAQNPQDFWRRWHISLSTWLRDYLYISLGGNRVSPLKTYRNLMVTMILGGLWHGAAWNFVLWGFYQGIVLSIHRLWVSWWVKPEKSSVFQNALKIGSCLIFILYGWLLFRAESLTQIIDFTSKIFTITNLNFGADLPRLSALVGIPLLILLDIISYNKDEYYYHQLPQAIRGGFYAVMIFAILLGISNETSQFIYFAF